MRWIYIKVVLQLLLLPGQVVCAYCVPESRSNMARSRMPKKVYRLESHVSSCRLRQSAAVRVHMQQAASIVLALGPSRGWFGSACCNAIRIAMISLLPKHKTN